MSEDQAQRRDWFVDAIGKVGVAAEDVHRSMNRIVGQLQDAASRRAAGATLLEVVHQILEEDGRESRLAPTVAYQSFERAVTAYRAQTIRHLVDNEDLTFTDVARLIGVSRQMVARLYQSAEPPPEEVRTPLT